MSKNDASPSPLDKNERSRYESKIRRLEARIKELEQKLEEKNEAHPPEKNNEPATTSSGDDKEKKSSELSSDEILRYSRQLLLSQGFGVVGQKKLLSSSVLVIGAGGIGSTALMYLAAAGVGNITIADHDIVERSNLHRQIIHTDHASTTLKKVDSALQTLHNLNPTIQYHTHPHKVTYSNIINLLSNHDIIVDATDNTESRYMINDACVLQDKVLISGSAVGMEGQLTVYNLGNGGCYRCLYPRMSDGGGACGSCSDVGVLGMVPGLIGVLQAVEVIKVLTGIGTPMNNRLLMYDSLQCTFHTIKKPPRNKSCPICSDDGSATIRTMEDSQQHYYQQQQGSTTCPISIPDSIHISCQEYNEHIRRNNTPHILLDVRSRIQYDMCHLDGSVNIPLAELKEGDGLDRLNDLMGQDEVVYCLCRRGKASVVATKMLLEVMGEEDGKGNLREVRNIRGGLNAWSDEVDSSFPRY